MSFIESPRFPTTISVGAIGGPGYKTDMVVVSSGFNKRNIGWDDALCEYDVAQAVRTQAQYDVLLAYFRSMKGMGNSFRFKDPSDYQVTTANGLLGTGIGTGLPTYQLNKYYAAGSLYELRKIKKPVVGTYIGYRNGTPATAGSSAGNYAIDTTTGIITWVADTSSTVTVVTVGATTQVTLTSALSGLTTSAGSNLLYLSGLTGADAALLNGLAHTITAITGGGLNVYTISTNTAGKTISAAGSGYKYPQTGDDLTWSGEFDVPCYFGTDKMLAKFVDYKIYSWESIPIIEDRIP